MNFYAGFGGVFPDNFSPRIERSRSAKAALGTLGILGHSRGNSRILLSPNSRNVFFGGGGGGGGLVAPEELPSSPCRKHYIGKNYMGKLF